GVVSDLRVGELDGGGYLQASRVELERTLVILQLAVDPSSGVGRTCRHQRLADASTGVEHLVKERERERVLSFATTSDRCLPLMPHQQDDLMARLHSAAPAL